MATETVKNSEEYSQKKLSEEGRKQLYEYFYLKKREKRPLENREYPALGTGHCLPRG